MPRGATDARRAMWRFSGRSAGSAVCQFTLLIPRFADGSGLRQDAVTSRAALPAEAHALQLCPCYKLDDFTHIPSPIRTGSSNEMTNVSPYDHFPSTFLRR